MTKVHFSFIFSQANASLAKPFSHAGWHTFLLCLHGIIVEIALHQNDGCTLVAGAGG